MNYYAGIGSRQTPEFTLEQMRNIAWRMADLGYILRSGGAKGADSAFSSMADSKEIFLPTDHIPLWTEIFTNFFHPNPKALKSGYTRNLMNRNALQILGIDGNTPVEFVVCWTVNGEKKGGTSQAIRIAEYYNIPVFNLYYKTQVVALDHYILSLEQDHTTDDSIMEAEQNDN